MNYKKKYLKYKKKYLNQLQKLIIGIKGGSSSQYLSNNCLININNLEQKLKEKKMQLSQINKNNPNKEVDSIYNEINQEVEKLEKQIKKLNDEYILFSQIDNLKCTQIFDNYNNSNKQSIFYTDLLKKLYAKSNDMEDPCRDEAIYKRDLLLKKKEDCTNYQNAPTQPLQLALPPPQRKLDEEIDSIYTKIKNLSLKLAHLERICENCSTKNKSSFCSIM